MAVNLSTLVSATDIINKFRTTLSEINRSIVWSGQNKPFQELPTGILDGTTSGMSRTDSISGIATGALIDADILANQLIAEATE